MPQLARLLERWPVALLCVIALAAAVLLPGLGSFGLWEPQERQLSDRVAPREGLDKKPPIEAPKPPPVPPGRAPAATPMVPPGRAPAATPLVPQGQAPAATPQVPPEQAPAATPQVRPEQAPAATPPAAESCLHQAPKDALARSLTARAPALGRDEIDDSDSGRRLPLALLGLLTVVAAAGIAMRTTGSRAGVLTALVLLSMPLLVLQSRQLTSEIGTAAGATLIVYGLVALGRAPRLLGVIEAIVSLAAIAAGIAVGFLAGGALLGVLVPLGAYAAAGGLGAPAIGTLIRTIRGVHADPNAASGEASIVEQLKVVLATLAALAVIGLLVYQLYDLREPQPWVTPQQRALLGKAIVPSGCWSSALGAIWKVEDDLRYIYDSTFEQIAYGTFPWGILAPIAIAGLLASKDAGRRQVGALTLAWAGGAWIAGEAFQRKVGFTLYAGFPAIAIAIGAWLDCVLARDKGDRMPRGAMLIGLFVGLGVLDLGKDLQSFTERLTSMLVGGDAVPYPATSRLLWLPTKLWVLIVGLYVALGFAIAMITWREPSPDDELANRRGEWILTALAALTLPIGLIVRMFIAWDLPRAAKLRLAHRAGLAAAVGGTVVMAVFWAFVWQPALAEHLSSKAMFDTYLELQKPGDSLVIMGDLGDAPHDYAPDAKPETVASRPEIVTALGRPNRVFAVAPQTELCQLHREIGGKAYYVLDDRNLRSLLISNRVDGTTDKNPLRTAILHAEPTNIPTRATGRIVFDSRIQLLGWDIPKVVGRGSKFEVTMFYKILQPVGQTWKVLFHFDGPLRFNGDHDPINGRCATSTWQPGDYIVDKYTVTAGGGAFATGPYEVWSGFFTGSAPNWRNMPVSEAPGNLRDTADRVKITTITLD